jgi:hypothetical protein
MYKNDTKKIASSKFVCRGGEYASPPPDGRQIIGIQALLRLTKLFFTSAF